MSRLFPEGHELSFAVSCEESNRIRETATREMAITGRFPEGLLSQNKESVTYVI
jgi:hypothetical protein